MGKSTYNPKTISTVITAMSNFSVQYNFQVNLILLVLHAFYYLAVGDSCSITSNVSKCVHKY